MVLRKALREKGEYSFLYWAEAERQTGFLFEGRKEEEKKERKKEKKEKKRKKERKKEREREKESEVWGIQIMAN